MLNSNEKIQIERVRRTGKQHAEKPRTIVLWWKLVGKKGSKELCENIKEMLESIGVKIEHLRVHGLDGTNTMSGERFVFSVPLHVPAFLVFIN